MLRITVSKRKDHPMYVLEGRLAGNWVQELMSVTSELNQGSNAIIDIEHVHYADPLGEKALQWLNRLGAAFVVQNAYGVDLCDRLELSRVSVSEVEKKKHSSTIARPMPRPTVRAARRLSP